MLEEQALKSDGESTKMSVLTEMKDLIAVKNFAKEQNYVDSENIILLGESQGGFVSGLVAAKCGAEIKKLVMIFPALCIPDHALSSLLKQTFLYSHHHFLALALQAYYHRHKN